MTTFLLYADALHSPEVRHEIAEPVGDPIVFAEHDGRRLVVAPRWDTAVFERREDVVDEVWSYAELGQDQLIRDPDFPEHMIGAELVLRAVRRLEAGSVTVPATFPVGVSDHLRAGGVEVVVDAEGWSMRRRRKSPWELEGIERAQRAADTAMLAATHMLRAAEPTAGGKLRFEGEILTAELIREAMIAELLNQGTETDVILVQSGDTALSGHDAGSGPILPDRACVIDCFPRDRHTGVHTDMTRTLVPGTPSDDIRSFHKHCRTALEIAFESIKPGRADADERVSDHFASQGFPTLRAHEGEGALDRGFMHSLGHGVGLEVHEKPTLGRRSDELVVGDVVAVEPGLYLEGVGGVRLEDTVLVTADGCHPFTDPFPYDLEP